MLVPEPVLRELEDSVELDDTTRRLRTVPVSLYALATGVSPLLAGKLDLGEAGGDPTRTGAFGRHRGAGRPKARRVARRRSIPMMGSLAVLLHTKRRGKLDSVA